MGNLLFDARHHSPPLIEERRRVLLTKVGRAAAAMAVFTLAWALVDFLTVPGLIFYWLFFGRLFAGLMLFALYRLSAGRAIGGRTALAALLLISVLFFVTADLVFITASDPVGIAAGSDVYRNSAFLLAVAISLFPLTVLEAGAVAVPILLLMLVQIACAPDGDLIKEIATLWRLTLVIGIAGIASVSQLNVLIDMTRRATLDLLTGTLTRRAGELSLKREFNLARRSATPLALLFLDLDRFKQVNDRFGHEAGDAVLHNAADALTSTLRAQDSVIRWGGEEFLVMLPNTSAKAAEDAIARIAAHGLGLKPDGQPQAASIGLAERIADRAGDWESLVEAADRRMYAAKSAGRNRWVDGAGIDHRFIAGIDDEAPAVSPAGL